MPTDDPKMDRPTRRPWWVGPGIGAVLGAIVIAIAAQGSQAGSPVALPTGPNLAPSTAAAIPGGVPVHASGDVSTQDGTIVVPLHQVVTLAGIGISSGYGATAASGVELAPSDTRMPAIGGSGPDAASPPATASSAGSSVPTMVTTETTEPATVPTSGPPTTSTTTTTERPIEPGDH